MRSQGDDKRLSVFTWSALGIGAAVVLLSITIFIMLATGRELPEWLEPFRGQARFGAIMLLVIVCAPILALIYPEPPHGRR